MKAFRLVLLCAVLATASASARAVRYPETGAPAFFGTVPDDWTSRQADAALFLFAPASICEVSLAFDDFEGSADEAAAFIAQRTGAVSPRSVGPIRSGGFSCYLYVLGKDDPHGGSITMRVAVLQDGPRLATASLSVTNAATDAEFDACKDVYGGFHITRDK